MTFTVHHWVSLMLHVKLCLLFPKVNTQYLDTSNIVWNRMLTNLFLDRCFMEVEADNMQTVDI